MAHIGLPTHLDGLASQFAQEVTLYTRRSVIWEAYGRCNASISEIRHEVLPEIASGNVDFIVISAGLFALRMRISPVKWVEEMGKMISDLRRRFGTVPMMVSVLPLNDAFPSLPFPQRHILEQRSEALGRTLISRISWTKNTSMVLMSASPGDAFFLEDGFHSSALGHKHRAKILVREARKKGWLMSR